MKKSMSNLQTTIVMASVLSALDLHNILLESKKKRVNWVLYPSFYLVV